MNAPDTRRRPRQKRAIQKVESILDAVEALVVVQGSESITTTQIAEKTGFAVGTIYQYYSNRTDLLMAAHDRMLERMAEGVAEAATRVDPKREDSVDVLIRLYVQTAKSNPGYLSLLKFAHANQSLEHSGANIDAFVGKIISHFITARAPHVSEAEARISRTIAVNLLSVMTDLVLLEDDPNLQERYLTEMIAHCRFALERTIGRNAV